jgi:hypothetical protein
MWMDLNSKGIEGRANDDFINRLSGHSNPTYIEENFSNQGCSSNTTRYLDSDWGILEEESGGGAPDPPS